MLPLSQCKPQASHTAMKSDKYFEQNLNNWLHLRFLLNIIMQVYEVLLPYFPMSLHTKICVCKLYWSFFNFLATS